MTQNLQQVHDLLTFNTSAAWKAPKTIDGCSFEVASVPSSDKKATRITVEIESSVQLFEAFITTPRNAFLLEPTLQGVEVFTSDPTTRTTVLHTKYAGQGVISARDFCTSIQSASFSHKAGDIPIAVQQLFQDHPNSDMIYVSAGRSSNDVPVLPQFTRGDVHLHGYIAIGSKDGKLRLIQLSHVDPKGNIPNLALESVLPEGCKKLARMKDLCEALHNMIMNMKLLFPPTSLSPAAEATAARASVKSEVDASAVDAQPAAMDDSTKATVEIAVVAAPTVVVAKHEDPVPAATPVPAPAALASTPVSAGLRNTLSRTLALQTSGSWTAMKTLENCLLEDAVVTYSDKKAYRISTKVECTLSTLASFLNDDAQLRKYDPNLDLYEVIADADAGRVIYSSYKRQSSLITPRDFCTVTGSATFYGDDVRKEGLGKEFGAAYVVGCISCNAKPEQKGYVRGTIVSYGFVALAASPSSTSIKLVNIMCVDPNGSIPKWMLEIATADACKKIAAIRRLCEERQRTRPAPLPQPAAVTVAAAPSPSAKAPAPPPTAQDEAGGSPSERSSVSEELSRPAPGGGLAEVSAFYEDEVDEIITNLTKLHASRGWEEQKFVSDCRLETMLTPICDKKAVRVSAEFRCSLETFRSVICNVEYVRKYDPGLAVMQPLDSPPYASALYTSYKSNTKLVTARDFCTMSASKLLREEEGADAGLYTRGMRAAAFVLSSVNCKDMPEQKGFVRGTIHAYGYIAVAMPPNADRIRVFNLALVDPMGSIPAKLVDAAMGDTCKKLEVIRSICAAEQLGGKAKVVQLAPTPQQAQQEQAFPPIDEDPIIRKLTRLHSVREWPSQKQVAGTLVQFGPCDVNPDSTVYRCSTEFMCSLKVFASFANSSDNIRRTDKEVEFVRFLEGPPNATISHVAYRAASRPYPNTDFTVLTATKMLEGTDGSDAGLYTPGITSSAFVLNSVNWNPKGVESPVGSVRGVIFYNGVVAIATPPTATRIRVFSYTAVDGKNVKKTDDVRISDCCDRLLTMKQLCEQLESEVSIAQTIKEEEVPESQEAVQSPPSITDTVSSEASEAAPAEAVSAAPVVPDLISGIQRKILSRLIQLNNRADWRMGKVVERCVLEDCDVAYCDKKALRITTEINCSLDHFERFLGDFSEARKYDPTLDALDVLQQDASSVVIYTSYKKQSSFVAPRDFCSQCVRVRLPGDIARAEAGLGDCYEAVVQNSVSVNAKGPQAGLVRGIVHTFGFIATAASANSSKITVTNIMCVDPCGSIPKWVMDAASGECCKKLALIRSLCEGETVKK